MCDSHHRGVMFVVVAAAAGDAVEVDDGWSVSVGGVLRVLVAVESCGMVVLLRLAGGWLLPPAVKTTKT